MSLLILAGFLAFLPLPGAEGAQIDAEVDAAVRLFQAGQYAESEAACGRVLAEDPMNAPAAGLMGRLALLANRLETAQSWLGKAITARPGDRESIALLAEVHRRRDDFRRAAPLYRAAGRVGFAATLEGFEGRPPWQVEGASAVTRVRLLPSEPVPLVAVRLNDAQDAHFLLDSGAADVVISSELAARLRLSRFGKPALPDRGRLDSLGLGEWKIRNVPVEIRDGRRLPATAGGRRVDGVLGTAFLYHVVATLDYPAGELVLERKGTEVVHHAAHEETISFWITADQALLASPLGTLRPSPAAVDVSSAAFRSFAVTFDFVSMKIFLRRREA